MQSLFLIGFFLYEGADIIDIFVEVVISVSLFRFFHMLKIWCTLEAFTVCQAASLPESSKNLLENNEIVPIYEEIRGSTLKSMEKEDMQLNSLAMILMRRGKIAPMNKCFALFKDDKPIKTKEDAMRIYRFYYKVLLIYVIVIPLCFVAIAVLNRHPAKNPKVPKAIISAIKGVTTGYCIINLITFVTNLEHCLVEYNLIYKFFSVKLIILFVIIQSIILGFAAPNTDYHTSDQMEHIICFFLLNVENFLIGFLWIYSYGYAGSGVEKYKNLTQRPSSNTELMLNTENGQKKVTNNL